MSSKYSDFINEITEDEIYDRLIQYGLFAEKLPPIFDAKSFLDYCNESSRPKFQDAPYNYVRYASMRNINVPRPIGIPVPMGYELLCACIKENWKLFQNYFENMTSNQEHKVSRIHVRKQKGTDSLFEMNYKNWRKDGTPEPDLIFGKKYIVKADISNCFPSIYSHSIPWALVGKSMAKANKNKNEWYNKIDYCIRNTKYGETHGLLIGPHSSNVFSEIILCRVDNELCNKWDYVRNIDDYTCYVDSHEDAQRFLVDLNRVLGKYDLLLNHKKTQITEIPVGITEQWVRKIQNESVYLGKFKEYVDYMEIQHFLDFCIELMAGNKDNASIIFYALKILKKHKLTENARKYLVKTIVNYSFSYPYIIPLLDEYVFSPFEADKEIISISIDMIYKKFLPLRNNEACSFAIYYAVKYGVKISNYNLEDNIASNDCILALMSLVYARKNQDKDAMKNLKDYAKKLVTSAAFDEHWVFVYECLTVGFMKSDWAMLKRANVSFLKNEFQ